MEIIITGAILLGVMVSLKLVNFYEKAKHSEGLHEKFLKNNHDEMHEILNGPEKPVEK